MGNNGVLVSQIGDDQVFSYKPTHATANNFPLFYMQVLSVSSDYLSCGVFNPDSGTTGDSFTVAKPYHLRQTPFDGNATTFDNGDVISYVYTTQRERVATKSGSDQTQVVTPDYFATEEIIAFRWNVGINDSAGNRIWLTDMNLAQRGWCKE